MSRRVSVRRADFSRRGEAMLARRASVRQGHGGAESGSRNRHAGFTAFTVPGRWWEQTGSARCR